MGAVMNCKDSGVFLHDWSSFYVQALLSKEL